MKNAKTKGGTGNYDTLFLKCFDVNLRQVQKAIKTYSGKHSIDKTIARRFIDRQISEVRKQAARDLIENTIYITLEDVSSIIEELIIKLYSENDLNSKEKIYIYSGEKSKSFYFISILALHYIRKHNLKEPTHFLKNLNDEVFDGIGDSPLIIIDDVSYSGSQLSTMLNAVYYNRVVKNNKIVPDIYILLIALNHISKTKLEQVPIKMTKSGSVLDETVSPFKLLYLPERLYTPLLFKIGIERYFYLNLFFSLFTNDCPYVSLYLDHKIADQASTYTNALLYGPIIPSNYDYKQYFIANDYLIDFFVRDQYLPPNEKDRLFSDFNELNGTNFNKSTPNYRIVEYLFKKLSKIDIPEETINFNQFEPFINGCNQNPKLLSNITDPEIINFDYDLFMVPNGCLEGNVDKCVLNSHIELDAYLESRFATPKDSTDITKKTAIEINKKINSVRCPISWYKKNEFKMVCSRRKTKSLSLNSRRSMSKTNRSKQTKRKTKSLSLNNRRSRSRSKNKW
jgi:hypothetical protein